MNRFSTAEKEYMRSQRLGRLATVNAVGEPHVIPVSFRHNEELDVIEIGGRWMNGSKKFRDILHNPNVAFVIDDVLPPWKPRFLEIRGKAEQVFEGGESFGTGFAPEMIRISPRRIISGGIEPDATPYAPSSRNVK